MKTNSSNFKKLVFYTASLLIFVIFIGCNPEKPVTPTQQLVEETPAAATPTPVPTATEMPAALRVNGQPVLLTDYESELARLKALNAGFEQPLPEDILKQRVIEELIGQSLLAQAAIQGGFEISQEQLQSYIEELTQKAGGQAAFQEWMQKNGFQEETFNQIVTRQLAAAWQRDLLIDQFPYTAPQVHLSQMLLYDLTTARDAYARLQSGTDFDTLAKFYDSQTGGELGWIPAGYLTQPEVEKAAFELTPGQYSEIIESKIGFHIIKVIERQEDRPLTGEARQILLHAFIDNWIGEQKDNAVIEINIP